MIEFENVDVTYPGGLKALDNVSLTIESGELVVVVGLSGAGKSTLLRATNGFVPITAGSVKVDGIEVRGAAIRDLRALRSRIGMIFQTFNLVHRASVINNVLMGRLARVPKWRSMLGLWPAADREIAMVALERVEIVEKAYVRASDLSGGQQQRVGIARALAQEPSVLLADEPVASLDPVTSHTVMQDLRRINRDLGITTIINLHFLDLVHQSQTTARIQVGLNCQISHALSPARPHYQISYALSPATQPALVLLAHRHCGCVGLPARPVLVPPAWHCLHLGLFALVVSLVSLPWFHIWLHVLVEFVVMLFVERCTFWADHGPKGACET